MKATRESYGEALAILGDKHPELVVLDADLSGATKTNIFRKKFPERFVNVGIAEQDLMGTAAGLALGGKIPFASTFAVFASGRAYDQVRNTICYGNGGEISDSGWRNKKKINRRRKKKVNSINSRA